MQAKQEVAEQAVGKLDHYTVRFLLLCTIPQLRELAVLLGLPQENLPSPRAPASAWVVALVQFVTRPGGPGLQELRRAVLTQLDFAASFLDLGITRSPLPSVLVLPTDPSVGEQVLAQERARMLVPFAETAGAAARVGVGVPHTEVDLRALLREHRPRLIHFVGSGTAGEGIVLREPRGRALPVAPERLAAVLAEAGVSPECVVLNGSYSLGHAAGWLPRGGLVAGLSPEVPSRISEQFTKSFYGNLSGGADYLTALKRSTDHIQGQMGALPDSLLPRLAVQTELAAPGGIRALTKTPEMLPATGGAYVPAGFRDLPRSYEVWYGTNRKPREHPTALDPYSDEQDDTLHFGSCKVYIPKAHVRGTIGTHWVKRYLKLRFRSDFLELIEVVLMEEDRFWQGVRRTLDDFGKDVQMAMVYIHGYNTDFKMAAFRAAQIAFDVSFTGPVAFFSWPSRGKLGDYHPDETSIEDSESLITEFLVRFAEESGAKRIHVLAHSMGNRGFLRSAQRIVGDAALRTKIGFNQLVLAAPDVPARSFQNLAPNCIPIGKRTTLYVSRRDRAVELSARWSKASRAGFAPPIIVLKDIDTVEVSKIDVTLLGHGYYAEAIPLLEDLKALFEHNQDPALRALTSQKTPTGKTYWTMY